MQHVSGKRKSVSMTNDSKWHPHAFVEASHGGRRVAVEGGRETREGARSSRARLGRTRITSHHCAVVLTRGMRARPCLHTSTCARVRMDPAPLQISHACMHYLLLPLLLRRVRVCVAGSGSAGRPASQPSAQLCTPLSIGNPFFSLPRPAVPP